MNAEQRVQLRTAFAALPIGAAEVALNTFAGGAWGFNDLQTDELVPDTNAPANDEKRVYLDKVAAALISEAERVLQNEAKLSNGVVFRDTDLVSGKPHFVVCGLAAYLTRIGEAPAFVSRARQHSSVRDYLAGIGNGFKLESLAACLIREMQGACRATQGTGDQGVDCISHSDMLLLDRWCGSSDLVAAKAAIGERFCIVASCKANEGNIAGGIPDALPAQHVRELIGGWLIQRSEAGMWRQHAGIKLLSPLQLILVTTYRLSDKSSSLCNQLGVAVWGITQLIYLICRYAPDSIFPDAEGNQFNALAVDAWIDTADRVASVDPVAVAV